MKKDKTKILLVEDDLNLGYVLVDFLEMEGFEVKLARDGVAGYKTFQGGKFDLCIFDVMMPQKDGFTLAQQVRKLNTEIPIIFLTAKFLKEDKLQGFKIGADDYITKPFDEEELLARINAILKRIPTEKNEDRVFKIGNYTFDYQNQTLSINGNTRRLTAKENEILRLLSINKNQILKRQDALYAIWGNNDYFNGRSFDVFITKLRKYLKEDPNLQIENIHTIGFILSEKQPI
jgi:DNA-binding response OmpR family regulator